MIVRPARLDEAAIVLSITLAAFDEYSTRLTVRPSAMGDSVDDVEHAMRLGGAVVAIQNDQAVGAARYRSEPDALYIARVAVLPSYRRRGVASAMMRYIEAVAPSLDRSLIRLEIRESLPGNLAFYESLGYRVVANWPHPRGADRILTLTRRLASDR